MGGLIKMWMVDSIWKIFLACVVNRREGEQIWQHSTQTRRQLGALLQQAKKKPLLTPDNVTPDGYMLYLMVLWHLWHGGRLSKSAYGSKCLAFFHLFHLHNRHGFPVEFCLQLGNLFRSFYWQLPHQQQKNECTDQDSLKACLVGFGFRKNWWCSCSLLFSIFMEPCLLI